MEEEKETEEVVLCAASSYIEKYYLNPEFSSLPDAVKKELQIMCVLYTHEIGGVLVLKFDAEGNLHLEVSSQEGDAMFDDIGSALKIKQLQADKEELFRSLELYYRTFALGLDPDGE